MQVQIGQRRDPSGALVVCLRGEICIECVDEVQAALLPLVTGEAPLVLDLAEVAWVDSKGLAVLVALERRRRQTGAVVRLASLSPTVARIVELARLTPVFAIFPSVDEALAA